MTENKRFTFADGFKIVAIRDNGEIMNSKQVCNKLNELAEENKQLINDCSILVQSNQEYRKENEQLKKENKELKLQNGELLYQIGEIGKNNKTCRECECFIPKIKYCYMWDMEVEADDVVVACDQRKVKNTKRDDK